ncbi:Ubiquitin carboxyl-terminal hydrolase 47 [Anthophora retusa]
MVCKTVGRTCMIQFNVFGETSPSESFVLHKSHTGKNVHDYIENHCGMQADTFSLYLSISGVMIKIPKTEDCTMEDHGVHFASDHCSSNQLILYVVASKDASIVQKETECGQSTYNPPPSPDHSPAWSEENFEFESLPNSESYVGLVNQAMTCYLNSLLQALYMTPEFRNALYNWEYVDGSEKDGANSIPYQLQKLFLNLQTSTKSAVETTALTKSFGWDSTEAWQQHDIQELCRVMFDALELKFKNTEQADLINRLYEGKMIDYVKCLECGTEKTREDTFLDIPLPVRPFGSNVAYNSVEEALRAFVQYETLEGSNQYHCEKCNKKCDAHKGLKFTKFPYLLTLHLKRFDFDFKTFHRIKLNNKVTFPDILNLNPFITSTMPNQECPNSDESIGSAKSDDNSITDRGTLDDDSPSCENSLPNSNHSTNHDQDDDEGIDMSNGPSTSNCIVHNHENEKNRNSNATTKGPYNYELFSIMIHSGSASGGHYYAYIKDFRTQEWLCFNDQSVTQITHDDIQKTYGGGTTRPYYSSACTSTNAYMLMYRQIDPARNTLPMRIFEFPVHIQELLKKMKENEDNDRKRCLSTITLAIYCQRPNEDKKLCVKLNFPSDATWAETTKNVYTYFCWDGIVSLKQCRLVSYDHHNDIIEATYEGREHETLASILGNRLTRKTLLLEIYDKEQKFMPYPRNDIVTKVCVVDVAKKKLIDGPKTVQALLTQTVREYKQMVGKLIDMNPDEMKLILRRHGTDMMIFVQNDDADLESEAFCNAASVFIYNIRDAECPLFVQTAINGIAEQLENIITLFIKLPLNPSEAYLQELSKDLRETLRGKSSADGPSKTNVNESHRDAGSKCIEVPKSGKSVEDPLVRNASPQLGEGEEWHTPEQSNSEDSSLSDSDKTLVGDAPGDDDFQLPYLPPSTTNRTTKMLNQVGVDNWNSSTDSSDYYFKVTSVNSHNGKFLVVLVDKRMIYNTLKERLEPHVGVPADYFKIRRLYDECDESKCRSLRSLVSYRDSETLWIEIGRALRNGEFTVKLYQFFLGSTEPYKYLFDWIVSDDMTVGQAKKEILAEMKRRYNIEIPYERCRLRKKSFMLDSKVFLDHQKFEELQFYSQSEMMIQELPDKDPLTNSNQVIVFVRRWYPTKIELGQPQEIVLEEKTIAEMLKKLSLLSDIPEEFINVARGKGSIHNIHSEFNMLRVDADLNLEDGAMFLYHDKREDSEEFMREEYNEIAIQEVSRLLPLSSTSRYSGRKEKALRIYLDDE